MRDDEMRPYIDSKSGAVAVFLPRFGGAFYTPFGSWKNEQFFSVLCWAVDIFKNPVSRVAVDFLSGNF